MHRICTTLFLALVPALSLLAQDGLYSSTITFSAGGEVPTRNDFGESSGPSFTGNYEYRMFKHLALEAGVDTILPKTENYQVLPVIGSGFSGPVSFCATGCVFFTESNRTRVTLVPFGVKGILPLWSNRLELFAGFGGAYAFHSDFGSYADAMLVQESLGGRVALDQGHHFWLGTSGHYYSNFGSLRQEWATWSADFGIRFGH